MWWKDVSMRGGQRPSYNGGVIAVALMHLQCMVLGNDKAAQIACMKIKG